MQSSHAVCSVADRRVPVSGIERLARPCILKRKDYVPGKPIEEVRRETGITDLVKVASNENPLGPSPRALQAMIVELRDQGHRYPDSLCFDLRNKLAEVHGLSPSHFFIDNGEDGVITMLGLTFINPGDEVVFGAVTFPAFENITTKMNGVCVSVPMTPDHRLDMAGFASALSSRTKMVFVCNPNNPTGTMVSRGELERLLGCISESTIVVCDEAYNEFADSPEFPKTIAYLDRYPNLVILRTFSKIMGLAGVRVGYAIANPEVVRVMLKSREPFPVSRPAQAGALAAIDDADFVRRTLEVNREGKTQLYAELDQMGLQYCRSHANFVMVDLGTPAEPVFQAMLKEGVIVRPLGSFGLSNCIRISISTHEENARTLNALRGVLKPSPGRDNPPA
jgi:histidinol-phosphate aminotransferase